MRGLFLLALAVSVLAVSACSSSGPSGDPAAEAPTEPSVGPWSEWQGSLADGYYWRQFKHGGRVFIDWGSPVYRESMPDVQARHKAPVHTIIFRGYEYQRGAQLRDADPSDLLDYRYYQVRRRVFVPVAP